MKRLTLCVMLVALLMGSSSAQAEWSGSVHLGSTIVRSTVPSSTVALSVEATSVQPSTITRLSLDTLDARADGTVTADQIRATGHQTRRLAGRLEWYGDLSLERDRVVGLTSRMTAGPGLVYAVVQMEQMQVGLEAGLSVVHINHGVTETYGAVRLVERGVLELSAQSRVWELVEFWPASAQRTLLRWEVGLEGDVVGPWTLRVVAAQVSRGDAVTGETLRTLTVLTSMGYTF